MEFNVVAEPRYQIVEITGLAWSTFALTDFMGDDEAHPSRAIDLALRR